MLNENRFLDTFRGHNIQPNIPSAVLKIVYRTKNIAINYAT